MKKILSLALYCIVPLTAFAQLQVSANGQAVVGSNYLANYFRAGLQAGITTYNAGYNTGLYGCADNNSGIGVTYGVYGKGINGADGLNIGVAGVVEQNMNGIGVLGSSYPVAGFGTPSAVYAGYFLGNVKVVGTLTANSLVQTSDLRLKDNILKLNEQTTDILDKVSNINVIEYNYKNILPMSAISDSLSETELMKIIKVDKEKRHYGVIAQELQELFPELVEEGQDGYFGVNYVELVPVLICAIQELKAQVEVLQGNREHIIKRRPSATSINNPSTTNNVLYQNTPNPFNQQTTIRFELSDNVQDASICIFDMTGKMLKKLPISSGMKSVTVNGSELGKGLFLYSLVVNGQEIDTKRMVISK